MFDDSRASKGRVRQTHHPMPKKVRPLHEGIVKRVSQWASGFVAFTMCPRNFRNAARQKRSPDLWGVEAEVCAFEPPRKPGAYSP
jgi:hypothetical protein